MKRLLPKSSLLVLSLFAAGPASTTPVTAQDLIPAGDSRILHANLRGNQSHAATVALSDGSYVAVWQSDGPPLTEDEGLHVSARLFSPEGEPQGDEFLIAAEATDRLVPDVAALPGNSFIVVTEAADGTIRGQRFQAPIDPCDDDEVLCLGQSGRFHVQTDWQKPNGETGSAQAVDIGKADSGLFHFFGENNLELLVKVLDGCSYNDSFWIFYAATTNLGLSLTVTDTWTGQTRAYSGPVDHPADTVTDTVAFSTCNASPESVIDLGTPARVGDEILISDAATAHRFQPLVAPFADGGFLVVWQEHLDPLEDHPFASARGRRFNSNGTPRADAFLIAPQVVSDLSFDVGTFANDQFMVLWELGNIYFRRFQGDGEPVGDLLSIADSPEHASLATSPGGGFAIARERFEYLYTGFVSVWRTSLHSQTFDADDQAIGPLHDIGDSSEVHLFGGSEGTAITALSSDRYLAVVNGPQGNYGQVLTTSGTQVGDAFPLFASDSLAAAAHQGSALIVGRTGSPETSGDITGRFYLPPEEAEPEICVDPETLCLGEADRFQVRVRWNTDSGESGPGRIVDLGQRDSGLFYFFGEDNLEMLIKVLDGCSFNDHFWVFFAATTNVGFEVTVTDTWTAETRVYTNETGHTADAVTDTSAFASCPQP